MALRRGKAKAPSPPAEKEDEEEETAPKDCSNGGHRYQNAQFGYTGETVKVRPYALAIHSFVPQFDNELALSDGDVVYLTRHVDMIITIITINSSGTSTLTGWRAN